MSEHTFPVRYSWMEKGVLKTASTVIRGETFPKARQAFIRNNPHLIGVHTIVTGDQPVPFKSTLP